LIKKSASKPRPARLKTVFIAAAIVSILSREEKHPLFHPFFASKNTPQK
jgi:hypothetical protein